jgi:plastocyanin
MTLKSRTLIIMAAAMIVAMIAVACGSESTADIVATSQAQNKLDNDNATRQAIIDAGGDPDNPQGPQVGSGSLAEKAQEAAKATATALAQATPTPVPTAVIIDVPDGPTLTDADNPTIQIGDNVFEPDLIKVKVGTTVTWENPRRSASSTRSLEGEAEQWDSDALSKGTFDKEPARFTHTFTIPGCHKYGSFFSGETSRAAVCVVE